MGRKPLPEDEKQGATLSIRLRAGLNTALDQAVDGRKCTKSELVVAILEAAVNRGSAATFVAEVEAAKVAKITTLRREDVIRRLQAVEDQRAILKAALMVMDTSAPLTIDD